MSDIKPKFEVHKLDGKRTRKFVTSKVQLNGAGEPVLDKNDNPVLAGGFEHSEKEVDAGWMVYFPSGSSIHIWTEEEMQRQGFLREPGLVNMDTGDEVDPEVNVSLKARSEQKSARSRSSKVAQV
jgi:hypothetical protein